MLSFTQKISLLQSLDTARIVASMEAEQEKLKAQVDEYLHFQSEQSGYLASLGSDCSEVKRIIAELQMPVDPGAKAPTVAQRDAWIIQQRTQNQELAEAIQKQKMAFFTSENYRIEIENIRRKIDSYMAIIRLKTAQILFLAGEVS